MNRRGLVLPSLTVLISMGVIVLIFTMLPLPAVACSLAACLDHGIDVAGTFEVVVKHDGRPLRGVGIEITTYDAPGVSRVVLSAAIDVAGIAHITKLQPGDYWLDVKYLGIGAANHCFHVDRRWSWRAKHVLAFSWGNFALSTRAVAGSLIDSQPGTGGTPISNLIHRTEVPISGAQLRLRNAITGDVLNTTSDALGAFDFGAVSDGTYVLHIEGGVGRSYDPTDEVVKVATAAVRNALAFSRLESDCGDAHLMLSPTPPIPASGKDANPH